jgi:hypothetical protein
MVAGLSLVAAPLAAAAHTGNLYTWAYSEDSNFFGITDISTTDAALTQLHPAPVEQYVSGADICNEVAWALVDGNQEGEIPGVLTWNHDTGVLGARQEMTANIADFPGSTEVELLEASAADSLSGCTAIAYVRYRVTSGETAIDPLYVSYVDVATGLTTPITQLPEVGEEQEFIDWNGIATNPVTGVTYLFAEFEDASNFVVLNVATGTLSGLQAMDGVPATLDGENAPSEADFQPDGKLWLLGFAGGAYQLLSFPVGSDLATASPTVVGDPNEGTNPVFYRGDAVLTYDPEALAATGAGVPLGLLVPGGALFLAGLALIAVRRARAAE